MTRADRKKPPPGPRKSVGRRVGENLRAAGELGREAVARPGGLPDKAHGWFRSWFRKVWKVRGGGLYAVGFALAFLFFEIREAVVEDIPQFVAMNNILSSELIGFGIQFLVDTLINFVRALLWPMYVVMLWPPAGAIALAAAFILFPRYLKKPIESWLFQDADADS
ncbi:MAG: hypothetical protein GWP64_00270 [Gammaproteobacteria bacterium]|nr:hypothetical protein [Gammaproteobacteria bacterium]MDH3904873.1 hypothetical protein [Gammaproteobacteria bacterium]MDH4005339.1 hypothetical protein [Gammaproteobacteria bacterium]NCF58271.1 hypothetical protein [Gammaproteobacteria bacterium]